MKTHVVAKVSIAAKREHVFKYIKHLKYHQLWNANVQEISPVVSLKQGLVYEVTSMLLGVQVVMVNRVLKYEPNRGFEVECSTGPLNYHVKFEVEGDDGTTSVTCTTTVSTVGQAFAFTGPVLRMLARREIQSDLYALKAVAEQRLQ